MSPVVRPPSASPLPWRPYLALLVPLILTHMLQSLGGFIDGVWLGQLLGVRGGLWWAYPAGFGAMLLLQSFYCAGVWRRAVLPRTILTAKGTT